MKKVYLLSAVACLLVAFIFLFSCNKNEHTPKPAEKNLRLVSEDSAKAIAVTFNPANFYNTSNPNNHSPFRSPLNGHNAISTVDIIRDSAGQPAIYVVSFADNAGFVYVSADYNMQPLLGFVERGHFGDGKLPYGMQLWVDQKLNHIRMVREGFYDNKSAAAAWEAYSGQNQPHANPPTKTPDTKLPPPTGCNNLPPSTSNTVGPVLPTTWGQSCSYNELCPQIGCPDCTPSALTGCIATAISQVTRYWTTANANNYNYGGMPLTQGNGEVERLMHDAGLAVNMAYGCAATGGSGSQAQYIAPALLNNFGFTSAVLEGYNIVHVFNNLGGGWPVILCAFDALHAGQNGHCWVVDGIQNGTIYYCIDNNLQSESYAYFHMNWGEHEIFGNNDFNGWFSTDNWTVTGWYGPGTAADWQSGISQVYNIHP